MTKYFAKKRTTNIPIKTTTSGAWRQNKIKQKIREIEWKRDSGGNRNTGNEDRLRWKEVEISHEIFIYYYFSPSPSLLLQLKVMKNIALLRKLKKFPSWTLQFDVNIIQYMLYNDVYNHNHNC